MATIFYTIAYSIYIKQYLWLTECLCTYRQKFKLLE